MAYMLLSYERAELLAKHLLLQVIKDKGKFSYKIASSELEQATAKLARLLLSTQLGYRLISLTDNTPKHDKDKLKELAQKLRLPADIISFYEKTPFQMARDLFSFSNIFHCSYCKSTGIEMTNESHILEKLESRIANMQEPNNNRRMKFKIN